MGSFFSRCSTRRSLDSAFSSGPHPVFTSTVVVPCRAMASTWARARMANRALVAELTVRTEPMAPSPAGLFNGNARWVWLSTNPGITSRPAALISTA